MVQQVGLGSLGPLSFTAARFLLGALVVLPFAWREYRNLHRDGRALSPTDITALMLTGGALFVAATLQQIGILKTSVTNSGFLTALYVPLVPLIALLLLRRSVHWSVWPAATACFAGTYLLSGADQLQLAGGDLWIIASALFWAVHVLLIDAMVRRTQAPLVVAAGQFLSCGLFAALAGWVVEAPQVAQFVDAIGAILYAGLLSVAIGFSVSVSRITSFPAFTESS